jgi:hypothetical protein
MRVIEAVEANLIDAYVRGQLQAPEVRLFEDRFLASPQRRQKVEFARAWVQVADESKPARREATAKALVRTGDSRRSWLETLRQLLRGPVPAFQLATAALSGILLSLVLWQIVQSNKLRSQIGALETERRGLQQQQQALQQSVDAEHARVEDLSAQLQRGALASVTSLTLLPGVLRGETTPPQLVIPQPANIARLEIQLEPKDKYPQFRAELRTQGGEEILARSNLHEQRLSGGRAVVLEIPSSALGHGGYEVALKGITTGRQVDDIGYYRFAVRRK